MKEKGYLCEHSEVGNVYYPAEGVRLTDDAAVNYVEYPWITCCEVEGIEIIKESAQL